MLARWWRERAERRLKARVLARWRDDPRVAERIARVMALDGAGLSAGIDEERALPGDPQFVASGWSEHMLLRYFLAMDHAADKRVLDTCCGLGWGAYLVGAVAREVVGVDLDDEALAFCRRTWEDERHRFVRGSVLELPFEDAAFDVVLCMEAIEHFTVADGRRYLGELRRVCRPGGMLVGSSAFPETRADADALCALNEHHLHIYTRTEMHALLTDLFSPPLRLTRHYFAAARP